MYSFGPKLYISSKILLGSCEGTGVVGGGANQCSGSMKFWVGSGSGSANPCLWLVDPDPAIFIIDLQDASKKLLFNTIFSAYYFLKVHLHHFSKIKSQKEPQNSRNQGFSYYFCMMIEGSGSGSRAGSGSIPLTSGSGSSWPKNMWIRWIRIRNRIRNTGANGAKNTISRASSACSLTDLASYALIITSSASIYWRNDKRDVLVRCVFPIC